MFVSLVASLGLIIVVFQKHETRNEKAIFRDCSEAMLRKTDPFNSFGVNRENICLVCQDHAGLAEEDPSAPAASSQPHQHFNCSL